MPGRHSPLTRQHSIERLLDLSFCLSRLLIVSGVFPSSGGTGTELAGSLLAQVTLGQLLSRVGG